MTTTQSGPVKRIVCLANSRKMSGRCIAGKELLSGGRPGGWVRPVSAREHEEVSEYERQYQDGRDPRLLDVIDVPLLEHHPNEHQPENWLLDPDWYWTKVRTAAWDEMPRLIDPEAPLWVNGHSTFNGRNDRVPLDVARSLRDSLRLIKVPAMDLVVHQPGIKFGDEKRRVQGRFTYNREEYWLRVTDPVYERLYLQKPDGRYPISESCLTVSLGEPYEGHCYKLIAGIIRKGM